MKSDILLCETRTYTDKAHTHGHTYGQLILPLEGNLHIMTKNYNIKLDNNHLFFVPSEYSHSFSAKSNNRFLVTDIPKTILTRSLNNLEILNEIDDKWRAITYLLREESNKKNSFNLNPLIKYVLSMLKNEEKPKSIQYIEDNFHKPISIELLATIENFNISYYNEWFKKETSLTPNIYIQQIRIKKAKEYLINTKLNILEIAQLVGYEQQSSLTRIFKKYVGLSPKDYRKKYR